MYMHTVCVVARAAVLRVLDSTILIPLATCHPWIALLIQRTPFMVEKERENNLHHYQSCTYCLGGYIGSECLTDCYQDTVYVCLGLSIAMSKVGDESADVSTLHEI